MQGNLQKSGRRHFGKAEDLKLKFEGDFYISILFWGHFRRGFLSKDMPCKRNSVSIGFIKVENAKEGFTFWTKKWSNLIIFEKLKFSSLDQIFKLKYTKKAIKVKKISAAARLAAAAHASACEKVNRFEKKKKVIRVKVLKTQFFGCFFYFWLWMHVSMLR